MKKRHLSILFLIAILFQGCPFIAFGDSDAVDKISLDDLQGCLYNEYVYIERKWDYESSLDCVKRCIKDSVYYSQHISYKWPGNVPDTTDTTLAGDFWTLKDIYYDTAKISIIEPQKDGYYIDNFSIWHSYESPDDYRTFHNSKQYLSNNDNDLHGSYKKGWTLCKE